MQLKKILGLRLKYFVMVISQINLIKYNIFYFILFKINRYSQYYTNIFSTLKQSYFVALLILFNVTYDIISLKKLILYIHLNLNQKN
jgi:hypothetical protein